MKIKISPTIFLANISRPMELPIVCMFHKDSYRQSPVSVFMYVHICTSLVDEIREMRDERRERLVVVVGDGNGDQMETGMSSI